MAGTSIRIFLPDSNPEAVRVVYKSHWTGVAVAAPRARHAAARTERRELRQPGVYVLLGPPDDSKFQARIYVGESEDPRTRLDDHQAKKHFWTRFVVFSSDGAQTLNKGVIRYLESKLCQLATAAGRIELDNGTAPGLPPLSEAEAADAEAFLADMLVIFPVLGISAFEPTEEPARLTWLYLTGPGDAAGTGAENDEGFLVRAGAVARGHVVESMPSWAASLRQGLIDAGLLVSIDRGMTFKLVADHQFASPSAAAAVLLGRSAAGPLEWKSKAGRPLRQLREDALAAGEAA